jgi:hypothetical protein
LKICFMAIFTPPPFAKTANERLWVSASMMHVDTP